MAAEKHSDGHAGHDALMAAITGEPLPPGADSETRGAYRSATADVALLREQLGIIGRTLSEPPAELTAEPVPGPLPEPGIPTVVPAPRRARRRPLTLALGALAVVCAGTVVTGLGWLVAQGGSGGSDDASGKGVASDGRADSGGSATAFGSPHYLACARLVAEGTVTRAEPVPGTGRHRVTLDVIRTYKPEPDGRPERDGAPVTFELDDGTARLTAGDRALIGIPLHGDTPDAVITGGPAIAAERAWITASLAESRTLTCD